RILFHRKQLAIECASGHPLLMLRHTPVIVYGCAAIIAGESLLAGTRFSYFLPEIDHNRSAVDGCTDHHGRASFPDVACEELRGQPLLVMVLHKMQHIVVDAL